ncbi:transmembrane protein 35B [Macrotis lagotis]|uniref:transmembrane protein 35B n=1 Tax=Macrotis lagotis TaxID=92651 RepID=UPI003D68AB6E
MEPVFSSLRLLLGLFFMLTGAVKFSDCHTPAQVYEHVKALVMKLAEVLPLSLLGYEPDPEDLLIIIGWLEFISGLLLAMGPPHLQEISTIVLTLLTLGTLYSLLMLREPVASYAPTVLCLGVLTMLHAHACYIL